MSDVLPTWFCIALATVQAAGLIADIWLFDAAQRIMREWRDYVPAN